MSAILLKKNKNTEIAILSPNHGIVIFVNPKAVLEPSFLDGMPSKHNVWLIPFNPGFHWALILVDFELRTLSVIDRLKNAVDISSFVLMYIERVMQHGTLLNLVLPSNCGLKCKIDILENVITDICLYCEWKQGKVVEYVTCQTCERFICKFVKLNSCNLCERFQKTQIC